MSGTTMNDCWNQIGVRGDRSCEKLTTHIHCRNCEVYAGAARHSLQRAVGHDYREQWAHQLRQPQASADVRDRSGLAFRIGAEWLLLPTAMVVAVAPSAPSHKLPHRTNTGLAGIVNVGGTICPAVALDQVLGIDAQGQAAAARRHVFARLVVIAWDAQRYALPVADLHGIVRYAGAAVQAPAATINKGLQRYLEGVLAHEDMLIGVLDAQLLGHQLGRLLR